MTQDNKGIEQRLDAIIELQRRLLALELARSGVPQRQIGKHLQVATATVGAMLEGTAKEKKV